MSVVGESITSSCRKQHSTIKIQKQFKRLVQECVVRSAEMEGASYQVTLNHLLAFGYSSVGDEAELRESLFNCKELGLHNIISSSSEIILHSVLSNSCIAVIRSFFKSQITSNFRTEAFVFKFML